MTKLIGIGSAVLFGMAGAVFAGEGKMTKADANGDGKITRSEASGDAELSAQFGTLDANKDGELNQAEFAQFEAGASHEQANPDIPNTTDDSTSGNKDKLGPGR